MGFCLSHISALEYWRSLDAFGSARLLELGATARTIAPSPAQGGVVSAAGIADEVLSTAGPLSRPCHVLVPSKKYRRKTELLSFHVRQEPVPKGSFYALAQGGFVVSPELAFAQCAATESLIGLMKIGAELTGCYSLLGDGLPHSEDAQGFIRREPLTSVAKIQALLSRIPYAYGARRARRALRYIPEGCASPMEAALALLLHAPRALGGYGLPKPLMNFRIDMRQGDWKAAGKSYYVCDLYWPDARLCVEYDSDAFHTASERIASDSARRNALAFREVMVVSITKRQLFNRAELDKAAHLIAKRLGVRFSLTAPEFREKQRALRAALLPSRTADAGKRR